MLLIMLGWIKIISENSVSNKFLFDWLFCVSKIAQGLQNTYLIERILLCQGCVGGEGRVLWQILQHVRAAFSSKASRRRRFVRFFITISDRARGIARGGNYNLACYQTYCQSDIVIIFTNVFTISFTNLLQPRSLSNIYSG